ncbi:MAG: hypothetical protein Q9160_003188 [Pyrenula sp. 1 TL-2023]
MDMEAQRIEVDLGSGQHVLIEGSSNVISAEAADLRDRILQSPLYERAWVTQEVVLAPRILHFTDSQIVWECVEHCASESQPGGFGKVRPGFRTKLVFPQSEPTHFVHEGDPRNPKELGILSHWAAIVYRYSSGNLTFKQHDKLVAINGLAESLTDLDQYIYGLWKFQLQEQLLWIVHPGSLGRQRNRLHFPTWSWASIDGHVNLPLVSEHAQKSTFVVKEIFEGKTDLEGGVYGAYLRVEADVFYGAFSQYLKSSTAEKHDGAFEHYGFHEVNCRYKYTEAQDTIMQTCSCPRLEVKVSWDNDIYTEVNGTAFYCVAIEEVEYLGWISGLILSLSPDKARLIRAGTFMLALPEDHVQAVPGNSSSSSESEEGASEPHSPPKQACSTDPADRETQMRSRVTEHRNRVSELCWRSEPDVASQSRLFERVSANARECGRPKFAFRIH